VLQFFGNSDVTTMEYISRRLGKTQVEMTQTGDVGPEQTKQGLSGQSVSIQLFDLLTPDEISLLFSRDDRR
jgi:type IV secretion system protein VirD4